MISARRHFKCCSFSIAQWPVVYPAPVTCVLYLPVWHGLFTQVTLCSKQDQFKLKKGMFIFKRNFYVRCQIMSHKKRRAKYQTIAYRENNSSDQEVKLQVKFPVKKTPNTQLTLMTSNSTRIKAMDIYKQEIEKKSASRIRKTSQRTKAMRSTLRLCSHSRVLNIYLTDEKSWIAFQVHIAWWLLLYEWCKMPVRSLYLGFDTKYHLSHVNEWKFPGKSCQLLTVS